MGFNPPHFSLIIACLTHVVSHYYFFPFMIYCTSLYHQLTAGQYEFHSYYWLIMLFSNGSNMGTVGKSSYN